MASSNNGIVKKIYRLEVTGYDSIHKQFTTLSDDLLKIKKLIIDLQGQKIGLGGQELTKVNQQIIQATEAEKALTQQAAALNVENEKSISNYFQLNRAYQTARKSAQDLAVEFGADSVQAKEAAAAAAVYKQQLVEINALVKSGGQQPAKIVPITQSPVESITTPNGSPQDITNLEKMGDVVTDLEAKEAALANEATAMGQAHLQAAEEINASGAEVTQLTTKYQEFTGSIFQNQQVLLENEGALSVNRAEQKQIEKAITDVGRATDAQTSRLVELRVEESQLIETNKQLNNVIRNQARELIADADSLDIFQAQLNQLQHTYEQLSGAEKASPFGQAMKAEIDQLEPKVFALENELGKFQRRVGDYPRVWAGALKTLDTELDVVRGKLIKGNFGEKELANLTAQEQVLANATKALGQQFATTAQQQAAFKEQGRILAQTFGTNSAIFKQFSAQVSVANKEVAKTDQALSATGKTGTNVFSKLYSGIRQIANFIPGLGISGVVLLLLAPLESLATSLFNVGKKSKDAAFEFLSFKEQVKLTNSVLEEAKDSYVKAFTEVNTLKKEIQAAKEGFISKEEALKHYNQTIGQTTGQVRSLDEAEAALTKNAEAYIRLTLLKAAANVALGKAADLAFKIQQNINKGIDRSDISVDDQARAIGATIKLQKEAEEAFKAGDKKRAAELQKQIQQTALEALNPEFTKQKQFEKIADDLFKKAKEISDQFKFDFFGGKEKGNKNHLADALKLIDAARAEAIAIENKRVNQIQKLRQLTFDEEKQHLQALEQINVDALNKKVALYNRREGQLLLTKKKLSADEKKDRAEFSEQITAIELDTSKKINDIDKKRFDENVKRLESRRDAESAQINQNKDSIINDINSTEVQKAQARLDADNKELEAQKKFFVGLLFLNEQFNAEALKKAKEAIEKQQAEVAKDRKNISEATIQDIQANGNKEIAATQLRFGLLRSEILANDKLTSKQRQKQLETLGAAEERTILAIELKTLQAQFEVTKNLFALGLITEQAFLDAQKKFIDKANELQKGILSATETTTEKVKKTFGNLKDIISSGLKNLFKVDETTTQGKELASAIGEVVAQSYDLALQAMNAYFDAEQQRIEQSLQLNQERLAMEEDQVKARATSAAEIASIEKQYAAKKKAEEKKAHEELRKSKRSEAKIAFAVELANIWAQAASYPPPLSLIIGGIESALAGVRLSLRLNEINRETFAKGGIVPTKTGGEITGQSHKEGGVPFNHRYEAEGKELAIVNKKSAQDNKIRTITGTNRQILSRINEIGGGISFASGAKVHKFESGGYLGTNLQPPVFVPASITTSSTIAAISKEDLQQISDNTAKIMKEAVKESIKQIQVVQKTSTVTDAQKKQVKQSSINSL
jgi:hypothetical protein